MEFIGISILHSVIAIVLLFALYYKFYNYKYDDIIIIAIAGITGSLFSVIQRNKSLSDVNLKTRLDIELTYFRSNIRCYCICS